MFDLAFPHLGIYIEKLPNSISIGSFSIAFYGMLIGLGIIIGLLLTWKEAKRTGQNEDDYTDFIIWGIIAGVVGARLYYVAFQWQYYKDNLPEILNLRNGGLAIYGTIIGALLALAIFCLVKKKNFFQMIDTMVPQLALAQAIGRWGNFFNMEAFGRYTDSFLAMQLRLDKVNPNMLDAEVMSHVLTIDGTQYIQVMPTFLIESLWCFLIFAFLMFYKKHKKFHGELLCMHAGLYGLERMFLEGFRTDSLMLGNTGMRVSQVLAGTMVLVSIIVYFVLKKIDPKENTVTSETPVTGDGNAAADAKEPEIIAEEAAEDNTQENTEE